MENKSGIEKLALELYNNGRTGEHEAYVGRTPEGDILVHIPSETKDVVLALQKTTLALADKLADG